MAALCSEQNSFSFFTYHVRVLTLSSYIVSGTPETKSLRDLFPDLSMAADEEVPDLVAGDVNFEQVATGDAQ